MRKRNEEQFSGDEFRSVSEYKSFAAEQYGKPLEIGARAPETKATPPETQFGNTSAPKQSDLPKTDAGKRRASVKDFLNKITETATSTVGTAATVVAAAATVAVCTSLFVPAPQVNLLTLDVGADYVSYVLQVDELQDDVDYDIVVSSPYHTFVQEEVVAGENVNFITELRPFYEYTLTLIGKSDDALGKTIYFEQKFYTGTGAEPQAVITLEERRADGVVAVDYSIYVSDPLSLSNQYLVRAFYENEIILEDVWSDEIIRDGTISGWYDGEIFFEIYADVDGELRQAGSQSIVVSPPERPPNPTFTLGTETELVGIDTFTVEYAFTDVHTLLQVDKAVFRITYDGGDYEETVLTPTMDGAAKLQVAIPADVTEFTVQPTLYVSTAQGLEWQVETAAQTYAAGYQVSLWQTQVGAPDLYMGERTLTLQFYTHLPTDSRLLVTDPTGTSVEVYDGYYYETFPESGGEYTYQAVDANETPLTETASRTVILPENLPTGDDYTFNYLNAGDILETYNEDGTINLYGDLGFTTTNEEVFYEILFTGEGETIVHRSQDQALMLENIPAGWYGVTYYVIYEQDGIRYELFYVSVSGTTGQMSGEPSLWIEDGAVQIQLYEWVDHQETLGLVVDGTERITLSLSDFTADEYGDLFYTYIPPAGTTTIGLEVYLTTQTDAYEQLIADGVPVKGSIYKQVILEETVA